MNKTFIENIVKNMTKNKKIITLKIWIMSMIGFSILIINLSLPTYPIIIRMITESKNAIHPIILFVISVIAIVTVITAVTMTILLSEIEIFSTYKLMKNIQNKELVKE